MGNNGDMRTTQSEVVKCSGNEKKGSKYRLRDEGRGYRDGNSTLERDWEWGRE